MTKKTSTEKVGGKIINSLHENSKCRMQNAEFWVCDAIIIKYL